MEELKASADPAVMYGAHYFLHSLLPNSVSRFFLNLIHRNSSLIISNLQGPSTSISIGTHRLQKLFYFMSPPPDIPITIQVVTYQSKMFLSISTTSLLVNSAKSLAILIHKHVQLMGELLSRRRVPGEVRAKKRPHHVIIEPPVGSGRGVIQPYEDIPPIQTGMVTMTTSLSPSSSSAVMKTTTTAAGSAGAATAALSPASVSPVTTITAGVSSPGVSTVTSASMSELTERLHSVQAELNQVNESLEQPHYDGRMRETLLFRLEQLKTEFSDLIRQIRRRKSTAEFGPNIVVNLEVCWSLFFLTNSSATFTSCSLLSFHRLSWIVSSSLMVLMLQCESQRSLPFLFSLEKGIKCRHRRGYWEITVELEGSH